MNNMIIHQIFSRFLDFKKITIFLSVFFIGLSINVLSQSDSTNRLDEKGLKHGKWEKIEYGKIVYRGQFIHGAPMGEFTYFYDDGKTLKSISNFMKNNVMYAITYHSNGKISSQGKFINKIKDSLWVYFGDNGTKIGEESYLKGKKNGFWRKYDLTSGQLLEEEAWKNDLQHGLMQAWALNGKLRYQINYKDGKANGPYFVYFSEGILSEKGVYKNSLKDSITTYFNKSGKVIRKRKFFKGAPDGDKIWIWNSVSGKKEIDCDSILYLYKELRSFSITTLKGIKIVGDTDGDWNYFADFFFDKGFIFYTPTVLGSIKAPKKLIEIEEGFYKVIFKKDIGFDVIVKEEELGFLKAIRPKLFKK